MPTSIFHTPDPLTLEIRVPVGDVHVETVDGEESSVSVEGDERLVEQTIVELRGRTLVVEFKGKKPFGFAIVQIGSFSFPGGARLDVRARVPHGSDAGVTTASGNLHLDGRLGALEVKTASGDVSLSGAVERDATIKTVSGDARLPRVGGDLRVQTVSGDLTAGTVGGSVEVKSVSGDARIESVSEGHVTVQSVSGDIEVGVAPGTTLDVDAGSVSGDLRSEVALGDALPAEPGPTLVVRGKTVSGDFKVFRAA